MVVYCLFVICVLFSYGGWFLFGCFGAYVVGFCLIGVLLCLISELLLLCVCFHVG